MVLVVGQKVLDCEKALDCCYVVFVPLLLLGWHPIFPQTFAFWLSVKTVFRLTGWFGVVCWKADFYVVFRRRVAAWRCWVAAVCTEQVSGGVVGSVEQGEVCIILVGRKADAHSPTPTLLRRFLQCGVRRWALKVLILRSGLIFATHLWIWNYLSLELVEGLWWEIRQKSVFPCGNFF